MLTIRDMSRTILGAGGVLGLCAVLASCGGGGGSGGSAPPAGGGATTSRAEIVGHVVDDALLGASVKVYALGASTPVFETLTGEQGRFVIPATVANGDYRLEVTGGVQDGDGLQATTYDQHPFTGTQAAMVSVKTSGNAPLLVGAASTGLTTYAAGDMARYTQAFDALAAQAPALVALGSGDTAQAVRLAAATQRALGWGAIIEELGDDGAFTASRTPLGATQVSSVVAAASSTGALSTLSDFNLRICVAETLEKEAANVSAADLRGLVRLECNERGITDAAGMSTALPSLEYLHLEDNLISDIAPMATLNRLKLLNIRNNRVATLQPLLNNRQMPLGLMVAENCIANASELNDTTQVNFSGYDLRARRQYSNCVKNGIELVGFALRQRTDGQHVLTYRSTYNPLATCSIDWGDGSSQAAQCDGLAHFPTHTYAVGAVYRLKFLANGVVVGQLDADPAALLPQVLDVQPRVLQAGRRQVLRITGVNLPASAPMDVQLPLCQYGNVQYVSTSTTVHEVSCVAANDQAAEVVVSTWSGTGMRSWRFAVQGELVNGVVNAKFAGPNGWEDGSPAVFDPRISTPTTYGYTVEMNVRNLDLDGVQVRFDALAGCSTIWLKFLVDDRSRYSGVPAENMAIAFVGRDLLAIYPSVDSAPQWPMGAGHYLIKLDRQAPFVMNWQVFYPDESTLLSSGSMNTSGLLSRGTGYANLIMASMGACGIANMRMTHPVHGRVF